MASAQSFSTGVDNVLLRVRPHGQLWTAFPHGLNATDTRRDKAETLHQWFVRLVDQYCGGDPRLVAVEENIAIFANFAWRKDRLIYASVPTLVVIEGSLEDFYLDADRPAVYLRLDLNYDTLGDPFSHPLAHVHVADESHPRFALDGGTSGNVIVDYLEFLYRNYMSDKWLGWARRQWLGTSYADSADPEDDPFERIVKAFTDAQFGVLEAQAPVIGQIKKTLREAKDSLFAAHMNGTDREILEYPSAR
jgi:hypothetical protein